VPQNFISCDREQELLLPPSLRDWLEEDHLAWCVLDAVEQIDLRAIYGVYRADGWGRAAFDPQMMVALLLYAYAVGDRSSRGIERRCREDVAFRVITDRAVRAGREHVVRGCGRLPGRLRLRADARPAERHHQEPPVHIARTQDRRQVPPRARRSRARPPTGHESAWLRMTPTRPEAEMSQDDR
jgi:Transposase domain (DUF772)